MEKMRLEYLWKYTIEEELAKNQKLKLEDINIFREWIEKQPHLPEITDHELLVFLSASNFSVEQAKMTLDLNLTFRTLKPELFSQRDPQGESIKKVIGQIYLAVMPERDDDNNTIIVSQLRNIQPSELDPYSILKYAFMVEELIFMDMGLPNGIVYICDNVNMSVSHLMRIPLSLTKDHVKYAQEATPFIIRGIHICNGGVVLEKAMNILKPFLNPKLAKLIHPQPNYESLQKFLPTRCLPKDFGGEAPSLSDLSDATFKNLVNYREWFLEEERHRVEIDKRSLAYSDDYGIQGTFRKLDLD